jgi:hypothetical protein
MRAFPLHSNAGLGRPLSLLGIALLSGLASHHVVDRKIISPTAPTASGGAHARRLLARSVAEKEEEEEHKQGGGRQSETAGEEKRKFSDADDRDEFLEKVGKPTKRVAYATRFNELTEMGRFG